MYWQNLMFNQAVLQLSVDEFQLNFRRALQKIHKIQDFVEKTEPFADLYPKFSIVNFCRIKSCRIFAYQFNDVSLHHAFDSVTKLQSRICENWGP